MSNNTKIVDLSKATITVTNPNVTEQEAFQMIVEAFRQQAEREVAIVHDGKTRGELSMEWEDYATQVIDAKGDAVGWDTERRKEVRAKISDEIRERVFSGEIRWACDWEKEDFNQGYEIINLVVSHEV